MFPKLVRKAKTPVKVVIEAEEPNEYGERITLLNGSFYCNYQDSAQIKYAAEKQQSEITGTIFIDGDILPQAPVINAGYVEIFGTRREISKGYKGRNFDGSVNYTRLDVI